ncbi:MAG: hypothetical protein ACOYNY_45510 [Caldilineaceae bacterium]
MNRCHCLFKLGISALLILLLIGFSRATLHAQEQDVAQSLEATPDQAEAIAHQFTLALANRPAWLLPGDEPFTIDTLRVDGNYAFFNAIRYTATGSEVAHQFSKVPK